MREFARDVAAVLEAESVTTAVVAGHSLGAAVAVEVGRLLPGTVSHVVALDGLHYLSLFPAQDEEQAAALLGMFRDDFAGAVRGLVEGGSPPGTDPALMDAYFEKMVAVRQPAGLRAMEGLVHWDMDAAQQRGARARPQHTPARRDSRSPRPDGSRTCRRPANWWRTARWTP